MTPDLPQRYRVAGVASAVLFAALVVAGMVGGIRDYGGPPSIRTGFNAGLQALSAHDGVSVEQLQIAASIAVNERHAHRYNLATALAAAGKTDEAIAQLRIAVAIKADYGLGYRELGMLQLRGARTGESLREAIANFEASVRIDPRDAAAWFGLGNALGRAGRWEPAVSAYREAVGRGMQIAAVHHNLGTALRKLGDELGARAAFKRALAIDPGYARSRAALATKP